MPGARQQGSGQRSGQQGSGRRSGRRSGREWALRGALALGALWLGFVSIAGTLANVVVRADAQAAHALASGDGRVKAALAAQSFAAAPDSDPGSDQARLAVEALRRDAIAVEALNVLGLQAQLRSEDALADQLFGYSFALSRRELQPQIWAIEKAVERGDIDLALANYDNALRTSRSARGTLFPVLASALAEPQIRARLGEILATGPTWGQAFIQHAAANTPDPQDAMRMFQSEMGGRMPVEDRHRARVVQRLVASNLLDEAWTYYASFRPGADRGRSRDPGFTLDSEARTPFDWNVENAVGLSAAILPGGEGGLLDFALPPSTGATVVRQTQLLPPGAYRLQGRSSGIDQPPRSRPYWVLRCRAGRELGRVEVPNSAENYGSFSGQFTVPEGCPAQVLLLVARASDRISGVSGQIDHVELVRDGG